MDDQEPVIMITKREYESLLEDRRFTQALMAAGVDSWDGYDHAVDLMNDELFQ